MNKHLKYLLIFCILLCSNMVLFGQSDSPCGAPSLPFSNPCVYTTANTVGLTYSQNTTNFGMPSCAAPGSPDGWFSFVVPPSGDIMITVTNLTMNDPAIALYSANCGSLPLTYNEIDCDDDGGVGLMPEIIQTGLTPGDVLYIRLWRWSSGNGTVNICVTEPIPTVSGCTDPTALNYNPLATLDDGSCTYIYGCTDPTALNYNPSATMDDGTCVYPCIPPGSEFATLTPAPPYSPGDVVTATYTLDGWNMVNQNWVIAFDIDLGTGWTNLTPLSPPAGNDWIWEPTIYIYTLPTPNLTFGPGWRWDVASNFGQFGTGPFTMSFEVTVGSSCLPQDLSISVAAIGDCQTGGWGGGLGCCPIVPYNIYTGNSLGAGNVVVTDNPIDISCNGLTDGSISLNVSGGQAPYTYAWSNGATTSAINNLPSGSYYVTVTDAAGCTETISNIIINEPPILPSTTVNAHVSCNGLSDGSSTINSPATIVSYVWSNGQLTQTAINLSAGTYNYTITDINSCSSSGTVIINEPVPMVFTLNTTDASCVGSSDGTASITQGASSTVSTLSYCPSSPSPEPYYVLNDQAIIAEVVLDGDNNTINNNTAGVADSYTDYTAMYADITEGQSYTISITLDALSSSSASTNYSGAKVYIDYNIDGVFDPGEEVGIVPYRDATTIGVPELITFTVPVTGVYGATRMRVVSQNRADQNSNNIGPCDAPIPGTWLPPYFGATEDYSIVLSDPVSSTTYFWSTGQPNTDSISGLSAGNYWVYITDANGCDSTENFIISAGPQVTVLAAYDQTICNGHTASSLNASSGGVAGTYSWTDALGTFLGAGSNFSPPPLTTTTTYTVTFTDFNSCVATDAVTITIFPSIITQPISHN